MPGQNQLKCIDYSNLAKKIFTTINSVFERDDSLDEFDIIPTESQSNKSPVIHLDHKLALESWCIPFLYSCSFKNFLSLLPSRRTQIDTGLQLSRVLILLNPDLSLAWNFRREVFSKNSHFQNYNDNDIQDSLFDELKLISLVASRKPKCQEAFSYRKWVIKKLLEDDLIKASQFSAFFQAEFKAAELGAQKYFSNYHAWSFRLFLLDTLLSTATSKIITENEDEEKLSILEDEKLFSDKWIESHVSDYSGFHYRQKFLVKYKEYMLEAEAGLNPASESEEIEKIEKIKNLHHTELKVNKEMILLFPGHESLWYHRRNILQLIIPPPPVLRLNEIESKKQNGTVKEKKKENYENENETLMKNEKEFIQLVQSTSLSIAVKDIQLRNLQKYIIWLQRLYNVHNII